MTTQDDLEQQLWDYIYGLLEPAEARALEERITSEHDVARAYAEARQRADMLGAAARVSGPRIALTRPSDEAVVASVPVAKSPARERSLTWFLSSAALMLVALVGYAHWRHAAQQDPQLIAKAEHALASDYARVIVTGPAQVEPEVKTLYTVKLEDLNGIAAASTDFSYALCDAKGDVVKQQTATTDVAGNGTVFIEGKEVTGEAKLKVWAENTQPNAAAELSLAVAEPQFETNLHFNKSFYRHGETVYFRTVTLPQLAAQHSREFRWNFHLQSSTGENISGPISGTTVQGVGNGSVTLPDDLDGGQYQLLAQAEDRLEQLQEKVAVSNNTHTTHEALAASDLPKQMQDKTLGVRMVPEGGALVAGLDNKVYLEANDPQGNPASLRGVILDSSERQVAEVATSGAGVGEFIINPQPGETYKLALIKQEVEELKVEAGGIPLPAIATDVFAKLSTDKPVISPGEPIQVEVSTNKAPAQLLVAATRGRTTVTQQFVDFDADVQCPATQQVSLPLADEVAGVLDVTLYDADQSPPAVLSQQLVYREPTRYLNLSLEQETSGDQWRVRVSDERGTPCAAVLGVNVVADTPAAPSENLFANWYGPGRGLSTLAGGSTKRASGSALGLALDTLSERFEARRALGDSLALSKLSSDGWQDSQRGAQPAVDGLEAEALLGDAKQVKRAAPPQLADNLSKVEAAYEHAVTERRDQQQDRLRAFALAICIASGVLLLAVVMLLTLRLANRVQVWLPTIGVAVAGLMVGIVWFQSRLEGPISIAARPVKSYNGAPLELAQVDTGGRQSGYMNDLSTNHFGVQLPATNPPIVTLPDPPQPNSPAEPSDRPQRTPAPPTSTAQSAPADDAPATAPTIPAPDPSTREDGTAPTRDVFFSDSRGRFGGGGGGGGGLGGGISAGSGGAPSSFTAATPLGLIDRLQRQDYYSFDFAENDLSGLADEAGSKSSLGRVLHEYADNAPLPIKRYRADDIAHAQPRPVPQAIDAEAIFWDPLVQTNEQGEAQLNFSLPPSGRYRITIDAHGNGRLGSLQQVIDRTPVHNLPAASQPPAPVPKEP